MLITNNDDDKAKFRDSRNSYAYPAVGLTGTLDDLVHRDFSSIRCLEQHHLALLRSERDEDRILGYISVIYWGHYSGQDLTLRPERALSKAKLALDGTEGKQRRLSGIRTNTNGIPLASKLIRDAEQLLDTNNFGEALFNLTNLPQSGFAFASKVCAFLLPKRCGVIDSVIARKHLRFGFACDMNGYVQNSAGNRNHYNNYCASLSEAANKMNHAGVAFRWKDRDEALCTWRAVDIERALY